VLHVSLFLKQGGDHVRHHGDAAVWSEHGGGCDPGVMRTHRCLVGQWSHARCGEFGIRGHAVCLVRVQQVICMAQLPAHRPAHARTCTQIKLPCMLLLPHAHTAPIGMPLHVRVRMETIKRMHAHVAVGLCASAWSWSWTSCQLDSHALKVMHLNHEHGMNTRTRSYCAPSPIAWHWT
jgi:hypothetical protein